MTQEKNTYSAAGEVGAVLEKRTFWTRAKIELSKSPWTARFGLLVIFIYAVLAIFAPIFAPYGEAEVFPEPYAAWSSEHIFGTDQIGRDIFSRMIYGARNTVGIAVATTFLAFLIGGALGLSTVTNLIIIIAVLDSTRVFRLTRAVAVNVVVMDYVEAAQLRGEGIGWIMRKEILPNIMPPLIAEFGLRFCFVFLTIAALSFLGVGIQPPTADWGSMVRDNASLIMFAQYDLKAGLTPLLPAAAIALLTVAINFVVDWFLHKTSGIRDEQ